jgi:hypothetical protein
MSPQMFGYLFEGFKSDWMNQDLSLLHAFKTPDQYCKRRAPVGAILKAPSRCNPRPSTISRFFGMTAHSFEGVAHAIP